MLSSQGASDRLQQLPPIMNQEVLDKLNWPGKIFRVSGHEGEGCDVLCAEIMDYLDEVKAAEKLALEEQKRVAQEAAQRALSPKE